MNPFDMLLQRAEKALGKTDADALRRAFEHPEVRKLLIALVPDINLDDGTRALMTLVSIFSGKLDPSTLPEPLQVTHAVLLQLLVLDPNLDEAKVQRPHEKGLPEALEEAAAVKEAPTTNLPMLTTPADTLRKRAARIRLLRKLEKAFSQISDTLRANLYHEERAAYDGLKKEYDLARPYVQANVLLRTALELTEGFLYDPAKQGAETNKARLAKEAKLQEKAALKGTEEADARANARVLDHLRGLVDRLGERPDADPPTPTPSTRKTPR